MSKHEDLGFTFASVAFGCEAEDETKSGVQDREEYRRILLSPWLEGESEVSDPYKGLGTAAKPGRRGNSRFTSADYPA